VQRTVPKVEVKEKKEIMMREKPKMMYDVRTVMIPKTVTENYEEWQTKMVAIQIPIQKERMKLITEPRVISIPRPMIEKKVLTKKVQKVIEVEEEYEVDCEMTEQEEYEATKLEYVTTEVTEEVPVVTQAVSYTTPVTSYASFGSYPSQGVNLYKTVDSVTEPRTMAQNVSYTQSKP
jgi:hypothetical protein